MAASPAQDQVTDETHDALTRLGVKVEDLTVGDLEDVRADVGVLIEEARMREALPSPF